MKRWSLRRHRPRAGNADATTRRPDYRPDTYQPAHAHRQEAATPTEGYPPAGGQATQDGLSGLRGFPDLPGALDLPGAGRAPGDEQRAARGLPPRTGNLSAEGFPAAGVPAAGGAQVLGYQTAVDQARPAMFTPQRPGPDAGGPRARGATGSAWPALCDQFGLHLLVLAEQLRISLDELESDEADPERLERLYRIDHAVTRMRRASRDLRTLAGQDGEELAGPVTSLLDVIRLALSAIERYTQVTVAKVADLAVLGYAADDVGSLIAALLDNATRYSPGRVTVSAHLAGDGSVLMRVEDTGIGIAPDMVAGINAMLAGPVFEIDERAGLRTGFPVVHRIARKHQIGVRLAARPSPARGTIAMVSLPAQLLCEIPGNMLDRPAPPPPAPRQPADSVTTLPSAARRRPGMPQRASRDAGPAAYPAAGPVADPLGGPVADPVADPVAERPDWLQQPGGTQPGGGVQPGNPGQPADDPAGTGGLPRRQRASLRGDGPRRDAGDGGDSQPSPEVSAEIQAAARRAFADDITAFSLGSQESTGKGPTP
jgi:hypothetical protein